MIVSLIELRPLLNVAFGLSRRSPNGDRAVGFSMEPLPLPLQGLPEAACPGAVSARAP